MADCVALSQSAKHPGQCLHRNSTQIRVAGVPTHANGLLGGDQARIGKSVLRHPNVSVRLRPQVEYVSTCRIGRLINWKIVMPRTIAASEPTATDDQTGPIV
jgi:hypothetical protein